MKDLLNELDTLVQKHKAIDTKKELFTIEEVMKIGRAHV